MSLTKQFAKEFLKVLAIFIVALIVLHWLTAGSSHIVNDRPIEDPPTSVAT